MFKLYSSKYILKVLQRKGFIIMSQKGSHVRLRKLGHPTLKTIVTANKKEIPYGTFRAILSQSNLKEDDFKKWI